MKGDSNFSIFGLVDEDVDEEDPIKDFGRGGGNGGAALSRTTTSFSQLDSLTVSYKGSFGLELSPPGGRGGGGCGGLEVGLEGRVVAMLAGLRLDLVGEEFAFSAAADFLSSFSCLSFDLQETGDPLEPGLVSSLILEIGFASTGGGGALAFTFVPVSFKGVGWAAPPDSGMTGKGSASLDRHTGTKCIFESTVV